MVRAPTIWLETPTTPPGTQALKQSGGVLRVAADPDAAPFLAKTATGFEGFEFVVGQSIADSVGLTLTIVPGSFSELPELVTSGKADMAIGQLSPSATYTGLAWSVSYLQYSHCLVVQKQSPIDDMSDLKGKKVGMYDDPVARQLAELFQQRWQIVCGDCLELAAPDHGPRPLVFDPSIPLAAQQVAISRTEVPQYAA